MMIGFQIVRKLETPTELPRILGPSIFPSNCCRRNTRMIKYRAFSGLTQMTRKAVGIAPMKGPKNGMIFVTPIITAIRYVYGILMTLQQI